MRALATVARHPVHLAVIAGFEPLGEVVAVLGKINAGKTQSLKSHFLPPLTDGLKGGGSSEI